MTGRLIGWMHRRARPLLWTVAILAVVTRGLLIAFSPHEYGYVWDFYLEGITALYQTHRLPTAADCASCYHPPLFYLVAAPFYALGRQFFPAGGWPRDRALWFVAVVPLASGFACLEYTCRLLSVLRCRGAWLVLGAALAATLPCLFTSTFSLEADILLAAIASAFLYYLTDWLVHPGSRTKAAALRLGVLAGLSAATKYSGLAVPLVGAVTFAAASWHSRRRGDLLGGAAIFVTAAALVGMWSYVDNVRRYGHPLAANGSAVEGFSVLNRPRGARYEFTTFRLRELLELTRPDAPAGMLTVLPVYNSVWTTLHGLAWGDMGFFTNPTRHGTGQRLYDDRHISPALASSVLVLGIVADLLAALGLALTVTRRPLRPLLLLCVGGGGAYLAWMLPQLFWAVKTKYILFLLPVYVVYAVFGLRWICRASPGWMSAMVLTSTIALIVLSDLYLISFAIG